MSAERPFPLHTGVATVTAIAGHAADAPLPPRSPRVRGTRDRAARVRRGGLRRAVRELELPGGPGQVWGGGEARTMRDVRRHLQAHRPDLAMRLLGYWKR